MENKDTEYIDGDADEFTIFLFSKPPKEKNSIKLELNPSKEKIHIGLHIFQELLMIFTAGMKYLFSEEDNLTNFTSLIINSVKSSNLINGVKISNKIYKNLEKNKKYHNSLRMSILE